MLNIFKYFAKKRTMRFLKMWERNTDVDHVDRMERRDAYAAKSLYIRRRFETTSVYVDIYWHIKKDRNTPHTDTIYRRCSWNKVKKTIQEVEYFDLQHAIKQYFLKKV